MTKVVKLERDNVIEPCTLEYFAFQIDPYVGCEHRCQYCYTQNTCSVDWETEVGVISGLSEKLASQLSRHLPQTIYVGMNTDPYQPLEVEYAQTRETLEQLRSCGFSVCILTKSNLVTRDISLIKEMPGSSVGASFSFADDTLRRIFEERTPPNEERLNALAQFKKEGVETYALISPVMPYITNVEELIRLVAPYVSTIWIYRLEIGSQQDKNWGKIADILERNFPEIKEKFTRAVFSAEDTYWQELRNKLHLIASKSDIDLRIFL